MATKTFTVDGYIEKEKKRTVNIAVKAFGEWYYFYPDARGSGKPIINGQPTIGAEISTETAISQAEAKVWTCESGSQVNDVVYVTDSNTLAIADKDDEPFKRPVGLIKVKLSATTCKIQTYGNRTGFTGLTPGNEVFLSNNGDITEIAPTSGVIQRVGVAVNSTTIEINIKALCIKLTGV